MVRFNRDGLAAVAVLLVCAAWNLPASAQDTTAPAAVTDLTLPQVTDVTADLVWTAPGDDDATGTATTYDIRYSTSAITNDAEFTAATAVTGEPAPAVAGTVQMMTVTGLSPSTTYYFAMKTEDEVPNTSALSNPNPSGTTYASLTTTCNASRTLVSSGMLMPNGATQTVSGSVTGVTENYYIVEALEAGSHTFSLCAGAGGTASYDTILCLFDSGGTLITSNDDSCGTQSQIVSVLAVGTYYVTVSGWSSSSGTYTLAYLGPPDVTAPGQIADLAAPATTSSTVDLQWSAPGDDGATGLAVAYDVRYSTAPITTDAEFSAATEVTGEPVPSIPGTLETMTVTGLFSSTTYYFAIKARDEVPNWGVLSNNPSAATAASADATPPADVTDLAASNPTQTTVDLQWTATGDDGSTGTAVAYDIRASLMPIATDADFTAAAPLTGEPSPSIAGTVETMTVTGLAPGTTYYFAMKVADELPNWTGVSNAPSATTLPALSGTCNGRTLSYSSAITPGTTTQTVSGSVGSADGDYFIVNATWPGPYVFSLCAAQGGTASYDSYLCLFDSGSTQIAFNDDTCGGQSEISATLAVGTYFIAVSGYGVSSGSYTLAYLGPTDVTPPAAVSDLAVTGTTTTTADLQWTSPGDDGSTGTAVAYDVRYSATPITTDAEFAAATAVTGEPVPAVAGSIETMTVTGLFSSTTYYFAIKTSDELPNWSAVSNSPSGTTQASADSTPPAAVADLAVTGTLDTTASLQWTAPGDDDVTGTAGTYDIRYAATPITTDAEFTAATAVTGEPAPSVAGTVETMTVTGLAPSTTYYFAIKTGDEVPNWSGVSNSPSGTTYASLLSQCQSRTLNSTGFIVPGTTTQTVSGSVLSTDGDYYIVDATWAGPYVFSLCAAQGGTASYDTVLCLFDGGGTLITSNDDACAPQSEVSATLAVGTYYVGVSGWGAASGTYTLAYLGPTDVTPPAAVLDLTVTGTTTTTADLQWTAPGDDGSTGTAASYDVRYATTPITTDAEFAAATAATGEPVPSVAGTVETMTISGLFSSTTYYFAMKTSDELPNASTLSNNPSGTTLASGDVTPPSAISNVTLTGIMDTWATVQWTSPGDDGVTGTAASYDVRYATTPITTDAEFTAATAATGEPAPAAAGTVQSMNVTGLSPSTTYYFAMKTADEVPNWSGVSNDPSGTTYATLTSTCNVARTLVSSGTIVPSGLTQTVSGSVTGTTENYYIVDVPEAGSHTFSLCAAAGGAGSYDSIVCVFDSSGTLVASADDSCGTQSQVVAVLAVGTNFVTVSGFSTASGTYTLAYVGPADVTAPGQISDLAVTGTTTSSADLQWTATGDNGAVGTAAAYDVRYSTTPITTDAEFTAATAVTGEPVPSVAGTVETMTVTGLFSSTTYYFAIKAADEMPNWGALSNNPSGTTAVSGDVTAPAAVADLAASGPTNTTVNLQWTAPGDDAGAGTATAYDIRYSSSAITTDAEFTAATAVTGEPVPSIAGTVETMTVTGLSPATTYYFAIKTADETPNWSGVSNSPSGTTYPSLAGTCSSRTPVWTAAITPGTTTQTASGSVGGTDGDYYVVNATWPGPYVFSLCVAQGGAADYDSYLCLFDGTGTQIAFNDDSCGTRSEISTTLAVGTYFIAVSGFGAASGTYTLAYLGPSDVAVPAAVSDLAVTGTSPSSADLQWTAPGDDGATGTATTYDVRYSTTPITTDAEFTAATAATGEPAPAVAGSVETMTVTGLFASTTYYFAIKTADELPNWSALSNNPT
ncbi:MAG: DVUA0089 family protein, partial [Planctomycetes bacterium]|nr:DVUA0089 family protein [Planctomycetota bacterium]